ncbi:MAG: hydroxyacid dehydrogenase [Proteobacteria bacterium]|nr:hydroxyacid dehydrogenase [Burkholderiales bacterium]
MKAVFHYSASDRMKQSLADASPAWLRTVCVDDDDEAGLTVELAEADVLLHVLTPVTARVLEHAPQLKLIQKIGVGVNTIDLQAAHRLGIRVANMPGANSQAVCEMTLALMLAAMRKVVTLDAATRGGNGWRLPPHVTDDAIEIAGKTVGLIGHGEVSKRLAPVLVAMGANVVAHTRTPFTGAVATYVSLPDLLCGSDVISLHLPLNGNTQHLLDRAAFAQMKRGVVLVNTARGGLVDESALVDALLSGQVRAAGVDVMAVEPVPSDTPLLKLPNVVLAPHIAWLTAESMARSFAIIADNCQRLRKGVPLRFEITLDPTAG